MPEVAFGTQRPMFVRWDPKAEVFFAFLTTAPMSSSWQAKKTDENPRPKKHYNEAAARLAGLDETNRTDVYPAIVFSIGGETEITIEPERGEAVSIELPAIMAVALQGGRYVAFKKHRPNTEIPIRATRFGKGEQTRYTIGNSTWPAGWSYDRAQAEFAGSKYVGETEARLIDRAAVARYRASLGEDHAPDEAEPGADLDVPEDDDTGPGVEEEAEAEPKRRARGK